MSLLYSIIDKGKRKCEGVKYVHSVVFPVSCISERQIHLTRENYWNLQTHSAHLFTSFLGFPLNSTSPTKTATDAKPRRLFPAQETHRNECVTNLCGDLCCCLTYESLTYWTRTQHQTNRFYFYNSGLVNQDFRPLIIVVVFFVNDVRQR